MPSLAGDILNRVRRLPKPTGAAEALQPIFEAVSNGMHAVDDAGERQPGLGRIDIDIVMAASPGDHEFIVTDTGVGLDPDRFNAFLTTDTDFKSNRGGKGIGRLLWLDAFHAITVTSTYQEDGRLFRRRFEFALARDEQVQHHVVEELPAGSAPFGTTIRFRGLRGTAYQSKFPTRADTVIRHFGSHFLAEFILGRSPPVTVTIGERSVEFPAAIRDLLVEERGGSDVTTDDFGELHVDHFIFNKDASADFDGNHQLHLIANGRTVSTRKIDGLVGLGRFGDDGRSVYHGCVTGDFLDERVNQERTNFNFSEEVADQITKACSRAVSEQAIGREVAAFDATRLENMQAFLSEYPSFGFAAPGELLEKTPRNAVKAEQFAAALIPTRIRRDVDRNRRVQDVVAKLGSGEALSGDFADLVRRAADDVKAEEQRQLTEYVLRRKLVLNVMDLLIGRVREMAGAPDAFHLEETLHQFICPMRVRGDDPSRLEVSDHDLWVVDERLTFAKYFASDVAVSQLIADATSTERPDVVIWDRLHGLGMDGDEPLKRVMLVEFKKPGRRDYDERYSPLNQVSRYLTQLANGEVEGLNRQRVRLAADCVFYCYVVADIVGALDVHTSAWKTTADGRGRWTELSGRFRGSIEIIEWADLVKDARARNAVFIELAR